MHLSDGQIQRLMHDELDAAAREAASRHTAHCTACAQALADARCEEAALFGLLEHLDHAPPVVNAAAFTTPSHRRAPVWVRRAAAFLLVAAIGGAAWAIPGSPLPALVGRVTRLVTGEPPAPPSDGDASTAEVPATSGIAVPAGDHFLIRFRVTQAARSATVSLTSGTMIRVRATGGSATFTTDTGELDVDNSASEADYEVEIPRDAARVEIRAGGRLLWQKNGENITTDASSDPQGRYRMSLSPPEKR